MSYPVLYQWKEEIAKRLPCLNGWQVENVGLFSLGIMCAESCQQQQVARQVATGEKVESCARRWRRFLNNAKFPLRAFFKQWTAWVVSQLPANELYLLVDETKLQDRLTVMMVGVAWEGRCLPLAWRCYPANCRAAYPAEGQVELIAELLRAVQAGLPATQKVIVLADRGIGSSPDLCRAVAVMGWYYLFRVTSMTKICTDEGDFTIAKLVQAGEQVTKTGLVFKQRGLLPATAHALWTPGYEQPWALVTNDPTLTGFAYAQRNWQEQCFRDLKSGGWQWADSRITHPDHMANLLVLLALAYVWSLALGSLAVAHGCAQPLQRHADGAYRRHWSLFREGLQFFFEHVLRFDHFISLLFWPDPRLT
jgi:hypothetical protein